MITIVECHKCPPGSRLGNAQKSKVPWKCDFCSTQFRNDTYKFRCEKHDFDLCESCNKNFLEQIDQYKQFKEHCKICKSVLLNVTQNSGNPWKCDQCKQPYSGYATLKQRCNAHDYDLCIHCAIKNNQQKVIQEQLKQQQQAIQQQQQQLQGFNQPPQQGFNQPPQQGFNQPPQQGFNQPPQQGFNQGPPPPQNQQSHPIINCYKCNNGTKLKISNRQTHWKCDFCGKSHNAQDFRLRCDQHDFDVCQECASRFNTFDNSFDTLKHCCKTCKYPLHNATYEKSTNWKCDNCHKNYHKYTELRLRCDAHDYDLCGTCVNQMQQQFTQPGFIVTVTTSNQQQQGFAPQQQQFNQSQQQQFNQPPGFNQHPQQLNAGFNQPPQQQSGFNQPPQPMGQGFTNQPTQGPPIPFGQNNTQQNQFKQVFSQGVFRQNEVLRAGEYLSSVDNKFHLLMQFDGNLVLYADGSFNPQYIVWSTGTGGKGAQPHQATISNDGQLLVSDRNNQTVWSTNTQNKGQMPFQLCLQEDRNLNLYDRNNSVLFSSNTSVNQQGFNQPPQFNNPQQQQMKQQQLYKLEQEQKTLDYKKQNLEKEKSYFVSENQKIQTRVNQESEKHQAKVTDQQQKQSQELAQLQQRQQTEMQQLISRQEQERTKLVSQQEQQKTQMETKQTQERSYVDQEHQKTLSYQQSEISKNEAQISQKDAALQQLAAEQVQLDIKKQQLQ